MGQEEYYSEQYSHGQGSSEPMNQQYYPDGNSSELHPDTDTEQSTTTATPKDMANLLCFISNLNAGKF